MVALSCCPQPWVMRPRLCFVTPGSMRGKSWQGSLLSRGTRQPRQSTQKLYLDLILTSTLIGTSALMHAFNCWAPPVAGVDEGAAGVPEGVRPGVQAGPDRQGLPAHPALQPRATVVHRQHAAGASLASMVGGGYTAVTATFSSSCCRNSRLHGGAVAAVQSTIIQSWTLRQRAYHERGS